MKRAMVFCRVEWDSEEWQALREQGWVTKCVSTDGIALMARPRRAGGEDV